MNCCSLTGKTTAAQQLQSGSLQSRKISFPSTISYIWWCCSVFGTCLPFNIHEQASVTTDMTLIESDSARKGRAGVGLGCKVACRGSTLSEIYIQYRDKGINWTNAMLCYFTLCTLYHLFHCLQPQQLVEFIDAVFWLLCLFVCLFFFLLDGTYSL